jgi:DnaJ-class molecular chaperone
MSSMSHDPFGAVPQGMRWCPHCNGYGSSPREDAERCTHCAGTGLVVDEAAALSAERGGNGSASGGDRASD